MLRPSARRTAIPAVVLVLALAAGCTPADDDEPALARQLGTEESAETAPGLLSDAGLTLPDSAQDLRVSLVENEPFTDASVVTFSAARAEAEALCEGAGAESVEKLPTHEAEMLGLLGDDGQAAVPDGTTGCSLTFGDDRTARVLLAPDEPVETTVLVYGSPER
ncbi:hypothetical protein ICW40_12440 [Actinotalea ferrariae]|uniref:hypothetical protein n=1 Tax=Actinotalea ferrariae TaxID=1386098 RepID=UPI001C8C0051|nr:hypothetical protein [Actinotalea ferrariae]MBX9245610.1 hypothetical protein [Actinotalea ferrariae]